MASNKLHVYTAQIKPINLYFSSEMSGVKKSFGKLLSFALPPASDNYVSRRYAFNPMQILSNHIRRRKINEVIYKRRNDHHVERALEQSMKNLYAQVDKANMIKGKNHASGTGNKLLRKFSLIF